MKVLTENELASDNEVEISRNIQRDHQSHEFFRAWAYKRMTNSSDSRTKRYETDEHAYPSLRINGNVYQLDEFYRIFHIKGGNRFIQPADRIVIW